MVKNALGRLFGKWTNSYPIETGTHSLYGGCSKPIEHHIKPYGTAYCAWPKQCSSSGKWEEGGRIIATSEKEREVVVMHREGLTQSDCQHEVDKRRFVSRALESVPECSDIEVVPVYYAKYTQKDSRGSSRDGFVLIRDAVKGQEEELLSPSVCKLTNAIYVISGGKLHVTSVRGVRSEHSHNGQQSHVTYNLTSLVVRSAASPDEAQTARGFQRVDTFSDWADVSGVWDCGDNTGLGTEPTAPPLPPDYEDVISHCSCSVLCTPSATQSHQHSGKQTSQAEHPCGCQLTHAVHPCGCQLTHADRTISVSNLPAPITHPHTSSSPCACRLQPTAPEMPEECSVDCETPSRDDITGEELFQPSVTCEHGHIDTTAEALLTRLHGGPPPPYSERSRQTVFGGRKDS